MDKVDNVDKVDKVDKVDSILLCYISLLSEIYDWRGYRISTEIKNLVEGMINLLGRT